MTSTSTQSEPLVPGSQAQSKGGRPKRSLRDIPSGATQDDIGIGSYPYQVDKTGTDFRKLGTWDTFSLAEDGSFPKLKTSRTSYVDLKTRRLEQNIGGGWVYRVFL